jgi:hypothetical protein
VGVALGSALGADDDAGVLLPDGARISPTSPDAGPTLASSVGSGLGLALGS